MTDKERIEGALRERINLALMEIARVASAAYNPAFRLTSAEFYEELRPILTRLVEQTRRECAEDCAALRRLATLQDLRKRVEALDPAEYGVGFKFRVFALIDAMLEESN